MKINSNHCFWDFILRKIKLFFLYLLVAFFVVENYTWAQINNVTNNQTFDDILEAETSHYSLILKDKSNQNTNLIINGTTYPIDLNIIKFLGKVEALRIFSLWYNSQTKSEIQKNALSKRWIQLLVGELKKNYSADGKSLLFVDEKLMLKDQFKIGLKNFFSHRLFYSPLTLSKDGNLFAINNWDSISIWNLNDQKKLKEFQTLDDIFLVQSEGDHFYFSDDNSTMVGMSGIDYQLIVWSLEKVLKPLKIPFDSDLFSTRKFSLSPSGKFLLLFEPPKSNGLFSSKDDLKLINTHSGQKLWSKKIGYFKTKDGLSNNYSFHFSPKEDTCCLIKNGIYENKFAEVLDLVSGKIKGELLMDNQYLPLNEIFYSRDGFWIFARFGQSLIKKWDTENFSMLNYKIKLENLKEKIQFNKEIPLRIITDFYSPSLKTLSLVFEIDSQQKIVFFNVANGNILGEIIDIPGFGKFDKSVINQNDDRVLISTENNEFYFFDILKGELLGSIQLDNSYFNLDISFMEGQGNSRARLVFIKDQAYHVVNLSPFVTSRSLKHDNFDKSKKINKKFTITNNLLGLHDDFSDLTVRNYRLVNEGTFSNCVLQ
jgi:hypothetical protein